MPNQRLVGLLGRCAPIAATASLLVSCHAPPATRYEPPAASIARGFSLVQDKGCGACHELPGLTWPRGRLAPSLASYDDVGLIAGQLPNTPANLAAFIRNAPAAKPGSPMPPMNLTSREAADVAAYLNGADQ